ncbi:hypothetical protein CYMTET_40593 [Cymbomonas tetramitiformis]|uniref:Uncharacterized protein n=1 Tax=Cymbomonas tetramitiformis TaxID=36881 RepID=A0AAE0C954_9CHLO|nr:hypothetical protein CYMTET_40593 [Cymbomonas tetramitiformis]
MMRTSSTILLVSLISSALADDPLHLTLDKCQQVDGRECPAGYFVKGFSGTRSFLGRSAPSPPLICCRPTPTAVDGTTLFPVRSAWSNSWKHHQAATTADCLAHHQFVSGFSGSFLSFNLLPAFCATPTLQHNNAEYTVAPCSEGCQSVKSTTCGDNQMLAGTRHFEMMASNLADTPLNCCPLCTSRPQSPPSPPSLVSPPQSQTPTPSPVTPTTKSHHHHHSITGVGAFFISLFATLAFFGLAVGGVMLFRFLRERYFQEEDHGFVYVAL